MAWTALLSASLILAGRQVARCRHVSLVQGLRQVVVCGGVGHTAALALCTAIHGWLAGSDSMRWAAPSLLFNPWYQSVGVLLVV
jgi:hypothetical protein